MKIISWNVNGIRAAFKKDFASTVTSLNPDILCIQETKAHPDQVDEKLSEYDHHYWNAAEKKGYAGTAIFSKHKPLTVNYGIGVATHDKEGRVITVEFDTFFLVNVYVPNSGSELVRLPYRKKWDADFLTYIKKLDKKKPVIVCGDLNVAHTETDLKNPKSNYNKTAGFTQTEIDGLDNFIKAGFIDSFREFNKEGGHYTFWSYRFSARKRNIGWRIDYFIVSKRLKSKLKKSFIKKEIIGSDHCPIGIKLDI
jgi:exodeoxyribonuclease III